MTLIMSPLARTSSQYCCCRIRSMFTSHRRIYASILCFLLSELVLISPIANGVQASSQQKLQLANNNSNKQAFVNSTSKDQTSVDDIIQDTIGLLDALDQKLININNKTLVEQPNSTSAGEELAGPGRGPHVVARALSEHELLRLEHEASIEDALMQLADGFSSGRLAEEQHQLNLPRGELDTASNTERVTWLSTAAAAEPSATTATRKKSPRQLTVANGGLNNAESADSQLSSDSTDKHIKFTLDLMRSIFTSQSYSPKTNMMESFLISPLSIQMVLMMMHLGARGQTKREISNCLHLDKNQQPSFSSLASSHSLFTKEVGNPTDTGAGSILKRRHQLQQQVPTVLSENNKQQLGLKPSSNHHNILRQLQQQQPNNSNNNPHELFGGAIRNLFKDPIVMKALTSANQIFLQKNLPLSAHYEWAIRHYYTADVKLVDFQHQSSSSSSLASNRLPLVVASPTSPVVNFEKARTYINEQQHAPLYTLNSTTSNSTLPSTEPHNKSNFREDHPTQSNSSNYNNNNNNNNNNIQQMINDWVERQTRGKISNFLSSPVSSSTLMMAINVLYFKGDWQYKFDPSDTETDAWFTQANGKTVKIPMMVNKLPLAFAHDPYMKTSVIELPYKAQRLGLFLLLPDEVSGIFHTMQMLNSTSFANLISSMRKPSPTSDQNANGINVRIPKFSIDSSPRLSQILSQYLGLKSLFMPDSADLSGMFAPHMYAFKQMNAQNTNSSSPQQSSSFQDFQQQLPLQVGLDELLHKAVLQVDEQGSVAAASSATIVERVGLFNSNYFEADHPFLLFLMDKQTGLVLFSGAFAGSNDGPLTRTSSSNNVESVSQRH